MLRRHSETELEAGRPWLWLGLAVTAILALGAVALVALYVIAALIEALALLLDAASLPPGLSCDELELLDPELWRRECLTTGP